MDDDLKNQQMIAGIRSDFDAAVTTWLSFDDPNENKTEINALFHDAGLHLGDERDAAVAVGARMCSTLLQAFAASLGRDAQDLWREILIDAAVADVDDDE